MICKCGCGRDVPAAKGERARYFSIDCRNAARKQRRHAGTERRRAAVRFCPGCGKQVFGRKLWCDGDCSRRAAVQRARELKAERAQQRAAALATALADATVEKPKFVGCSVCGKKLTKIGADGMCNYCRNQEKITNKLDSIVWEIATTGRVTVDHLKYGSGGSIRCRKIG